MSEDYLEGLQLISRDRMNKIWQKAKAGELDDLPNEERHLGEIMLDHEDELFSHFESANGIKDIEYDPETDVNPFLHVAFHAVVHNQVAKKNPIEAYQFYNAMRQKKCSHHDAVHLIARILTPLVYDVITEKKEFEINRYKKLLKKYKFRKPHKIPSLLDNEFGQS